MTNRKRVTNADCEEFVREARAGLIPASADLADEVRVRTNRTARMIRIVKTHLGSARRVSDDLAIIDVLADLRHYCDRNGLVFERLAKAAFERYLESLRSVAVRPLSSERRKLLVFDPLALI